MLLRKLELRRRLPTDKLRHRVPRNKSRHKQTQRDISRSPHWRPTRTTFRLRKSVTKRPHKRASPFLPISSRQLLSVTKETLKEIGTVSSRASSDLVKSGTTADVYSVNAAMQDKVSAVGGGGSLNSAYSAIATVPGAFVPLGQTGCFQTVHIRGGDYDQVGYELDGVPVNRSFDNYPSARPVRSDNKNSKSTRAQRRRTRKARASRATSTKSFAPEPIRDSAISDLGIGSPAVLPQSSQPKRAAQRRTATSRTTSVSADTTKSSATSISKMPVYTYLGHRQRS